MAGEDEQLAYLRMLPDAAGLFASRPTPRAKVFADGLVCFDTSSLLLPYGVGSHSVGAVRRLLERLNAQGRLVVPAHCLREFHVNRSKVLGDIVHSLEQQRSKSLPGHSSYALLADIPEYKAVASRHQSLMAEHKQYAEAVGKVIDKIKTWDRSDPVLDMLREVVSPSAIVDLAQNEIDNLCSEFASRVASGRGPGSEDEGKGRNSIGDFVVWKTLLNTGKQRKMDAVFVSSDQKKDWWSQVNKQPLFPRVDIVDEYRCVTGGRTIHLLTLSELLALDGSTSAVVEEIRIEERAERSGRRVHHIEDVVRHAKKWFRERGYRVASSEFDRVGQAARWGDFVVSDGQREVIVELKILSGDRTWAALRHAAEHALRASSQGLLPAFRLCLMIVVVDRKQFFNVMEALPKYLPDQMAYVVALAGDDGRFREVYTHGLGRD